MENNQSQKNIFKVNLERETESISEPEVITLDNVFYWIPETKPLAIFTMHNKAAKKLLQDAKKIVEKKQIKQNGFDPAGGNKRWVFENKKNLYSVYYHHAKHQYTCECSATGAEPCKHILAAMAYEKMAVK